MQRRKLQDLSGLVVNIVFELVKAGASWRRSDGRRQRVGILPPVGEEQPALEPLEGQQPVLRVAVNGRAGKQG